ncbi:MAG: DUF6537 domain-containing protein [Phycisphaerales bacterium JB063]
MTPDPRLFQSDGHAVMGTPMMLLRSAIASGVRVVIVSRLGSPDAVVDLMESHAGWLAERGVEVLVLPDAALAASAARGALDAGRPGLLLLDAQGAADAGRVLLSASGPASQGTGAGLVVAVGPWDSGVGRTMAADWLRAGLTVFEPAHHSEVMPWFGTALRASESAGGVAVLGLAEALWRGFGTVYCGKSPRASHPSGITLTGRPAGGGRLEVLLGLARDERVNVIINPPGRDEALPMGLVVGGVGYARLRQVISEIGLVGRLPILRLGLAGPVDQEMVERHARDCRRLVVVDYAEGKLYRAVVSAVTRAYGSDDGRPEVVAMLAEPGNSPAAILAGLAPHLRGHPGVPREVVEGALRGLESQVALVAGRASRRVPTFDQLPPPGSALVDVAAVLGRLRRDLTDAQYMTEMHGASAFDIAVFGELDDQSRLLLEHEQSIAGGSRVPGEAAGSAALGAGASGGARPVVMMNGRELFAHGYAAIATAARHGQDITFIIHTEEPSAVRRRRRRWSRRRGEPGMLDLPAMLEALGSGAQESSVRIGVIDPTDRPRLRRLLERSLVGKGVHIVLARRREGPRALRAAAEHWQEASLTEGYIATQRRLVLCPEVWSLNTAQRLQLGPLGLEPAPRISGGWMTASSWSWAGRSMLNALANPALGLATIQRSGTERSRLDATLLEGIEPPIHPIHATQEVWRASVAGVSGAGLDLLARLLVESGAAMGYQVRGTLDVASLATGEPGRVDVMFASPPREQSLTVAGAPGRSTRPMFAAMPTPGTTDLVLASDAVHGRYAIESAGHTQRTGAVIDALALPTLTQLLTDSPEGDSGLALKDALEAGTHPDRRAVVSAAALSEYLWGHRRFSAWVMLGVVLQRGLAPLTRQAIEQATRRVLGTVDARCNEALEVGRKLAVDPAFAERFLSDEPEEPERLLEHVAMDLAEQFGGRSGPVESRAFVGLVQPLLERCAPLERASRARLVQVAYRCVVWGGKRGGIAYAQRFCETVGLLLDHDDAGRRYELTQRGIEGAARAMVVPDEVYLAALLTSPTRYRRDRRRLNIALERGDKVSYRHVVRPEFDLFKRHIAFNLTLGERALRLLARLRFIRRVRTGWYREQRDLRDLYLQTLAGVSDTTALSDYRKWCEIASTAATISGRGETRRQAVRDARARLDRLVAVDAKELDRA